VRAVAGRQHMSADDHGAVGQSRWLWPGFAGPGVLWLVLLFLTPFYAILAVAMGRLDPIFATAEPVWNPLMWDPTAFVQVGAELWGGQLGVIFARTLAYVLIASAASLLVGYPVAYYLARHAQRWRTLLLVLIIAPFWINYLMRMLAWVNLLETDGYVNRLLLFLQVFDAPRQWLAGNHDVVILGLVYGYVPFLILPLFAALDRIDPHVIEAARDLGASPVQAFWRVTLPLSKQGILAGVVIVMLPMFGDYYTPNLLSGNPRTRMIGNQIDQFINSGAGGAQGAALTIVLMGLVAVLMLYYLVSVARATREATG
jgi:ABC-type spermidine/putrescine transport system permease subunit I